MKNLRTFVFLGFLLAAQIVLTRYAAITIPSVVRISFAFLPLCLSGMLFGPIAAGLQGSAEDLIGFAMAPAGPYFPGFTISAFVKGVIFGLILYKKPKSLVRIIIAVILTSVFVDLGLNTLWLVILYHKAAIPLIMTRLVAIGIMAVIQTIMIYSTWQGAGQFVEKRYLLNRA